MRWAHDVSMRWAHDSMRWAHDDSMRWAHDSMRWAHDDSMRRAHDDSMRWAHDSMRWAHYYQGGHCSCASDCQTAYACLTNNSEHTYTCNVPRAPILHAWCTDYIMTNVTGTLNQWIYTRWTCTHIHAHIHMYAHTCTQQTHTHTHVPNAHTYHTCYYYIHMYTHTHTQHTHNHTHMQHVAWPWACILSWLPQLQSAHFKRWLLKIDYNSMYDNHKLFIYMVQPRNITKLHWLTFQWSLHPTRRLHNLGLFGFTHIITETVYKYR